VNFRNANIGIAVGGLLLVIGCWIEGWDVSDGGGAIIMVVAFLSALAVTGALEEREWRARRHPGDRE